MTIADLELIVVILILLVEAADVWRHWNDEDTTRKPRRPGNRG